MKTFLALSRASSMVVLTTAGCTLLAPCTLAEPVTTPCAGRSDVLGVTRVVEIDAATGPRFGHQQYKDIDFLEDGEVVLTFDDGPVRSHTPKVLDALSAHCTKATFFMVGRMAVADPELVQRVAYLGHTIGSHTWSHANLRAISADRGKREIELGVSAISAALGEPIAPFFRFPYLSDPKGMISHLQGRGIGIFSIEVDSKDYQTHRASEVQRKVLAQLQDKRKGIILFHDIQASTAGALKPLLDELKIRGFKIVHIVPKSGANTVAEYDGLAAKELARRKSKLAGNPLAARSVVWPVESTSDAEKKDKGNGDLPWSAGASTVKPAAVRPSSARPARAPRHDPPSNPFPGPFGAW